MRRDRAGRALLACGIPAALLYVAADVIGALRWKDYRYNEQSISELMAIDAPSRPLVLPLFKTTDVLVTAFGWPCGGRPAGTGRCASVGRPW